MLVINLVQKKVVKHILDILTTYVGLWYPTDISLTQWFTIRLCRVPDG